MKLTPVVLALAALVLALAVPATHSHAQKIALVNAKEVVARSDEGAKAVEELRVMFAPKQEALNAMRREIAALQQQTKDLGKAQAKSDLESKMKHYAQEEAQFRRDLSAQEEARLRPVAEKVAAAIRDYAAEKKLAAVQDRALFLYYDPALDITDEILKRLNQKL